MTVLKDRVTVTVDRRHLEAGHEAVAEGRAASLSAWVNHALAQRIDVERRLRALREVLHDYEARAGTITARELDAQRRADHEAAVIVRETPTRSSRRVRGAARRLFSTVVR